MDDKKLDKYEKEILKSYENGEWQEIDDMANEINKHQEYAEETFKKNKRVNIRLTQKDLDLIKIKAMEEGVPYQTLMANVLHKYATDKFSRSND